MPPPLRLSANLGLVFSCAGGRQITCNVSPLWNGSDGGRHVCTYILCRLLGLLLVHVASALVGEAVHMHHIVDCCVLVGTLMHYPYAQNCLGSRWNMHCNGSGT
jgi:hypothetical protein